MYVPSEGKKPAHRAPVCVLIGTLYVSLRGTIYVSLEGKKPAHRPHAHMYVSLEALYVCP
jgi:hypothetical protein